MVITQPAMGNGVPARSARSSLPSWASGALHQIEAKLTGGEKVGPALHAIGDGACAHGIGEIDDPSAGCLFAAIAVTAGKELSSDLELDEGKIVKSHKRRPFRSETADRDGDGAVPK